MRDCPVLVLCSKAKARALARAPTQGAFCSLQGQPCQVMLRSANPNCLLTWKVLALYSRVKLEGWGR